MALDESREFVLTVDSLRSVSACPTEDGATVVLTVEDPQGVAIVELTRAEAEQVSDALRALS